MRSNRKNRLPHVPQTLEVLCFIYLLLTNKFVHKCMQREQKRKEMSHKKSCEIFFFSCIHEYMDIYSEIRSENTTKLIETPFGGRFCGPIPPRRRVSLYQGIALSFFTDKNVTLPSVFSGIYGFINACKFYSILILKRFIDDTRLYILSI